MSPSAVIHDVASWRREKSLQHCGGNTVLMESAGSKGNDQIMRFDNTKKPSVDRDRVICTSGNTVAFDGL